MLKSRKHVFWEALVITIFIFGTGILFGIYMEGKRTEDISEKYILSEINLLDARIQSDLLNLKDLNCDDTIKENIKFADRVYEDAITLEDYEVSNSLTDSLAVQHKRYDLLRTLLWLNSIKIKTRCGEDSFHTVVYLYDYNPEDLEEKSKQVVFSKFLEGLKEEFGEGVILIPIAKNLNVGSLDLLIGNYGINSTSIIVDENLIVADFGSINDIRDYLRVESQQFF